MKREREITVLTYNVRAWLGRDRRHDYERILGIIRSASPDIVALQEAAFAFSSGEEHDVTPSLLEEKLGMTCIVGSTLVRHNARFGNVLLSRLPIRDGWLHDISLRGQEPRGMIEATIDVDGRTLSCFATHLGLRFWERKYQSAKLGTILAGRKADITILTGDFNEWIPWGEIHRHIRRWFGKAPSVKSYPTTFPLFALDRIWARPASTLVSLQTIRDERTKLASDHLPVIARLHLPSEH